LFRWQLSKAFAGYLNSHSSLVDYPCSFSGLAFVNFRGMQESSALNIFAALEVSGLLIVILVSTLFLMAVEQARVILL